MADPGAGSARRTWCSMPERVQLHLAMLALQFGYAGFHVVSRAALNMGISKIVFIVYRNVIAFLLLAPFAYFLEKKERPAITLNFLVQFFLLALVGITANQGFYLLGLDNTSPTFASAIQNSVPAITFLMAAVLRIEKVRLDRKDGIAKILGTAFCVIGASVITLYKGPVIYNPKPPLHVASPTWSSASSTREWWRPGLRSPCRYGASTEAARCLWPCTSPSRPSLSRSWPPLLSASSSTWAGS
ncbi:hypothetical protein EUGRSUZ_F01611 [Eucalyptus grandis]|uniref:Uncharacterized protein n=2 Tax=Eucalyptus grandis TaxID=71139 RepID=A0ACC3KEQ3_EUCGR|nr:hypothetical protein EUGRSUZ_F01611 [Eucalyptus grandis]